jgi:spore coat protein U-like protein
MRRAVLALLLLPATAEPAAALTLCLANCSCSLSASTLGFGAYDTLSATAVTGTTQVAVTCQITNLLGLVGLQVQVDYSLALGGGGTGNPAARSMTGGVGTLGYGLYLDAARTQVWGDGSNGTFTLTGSQILLTTTPQPVTTTYTVYGRLPARQTAVAGGFADTIAVTLSY